MTILIEEEDSRYNELHDLMIQCSTENVRNKFFSMEGLHAEKVIEQRDYLIYRMGNVRRHILNMRMHMASYRERFENKYVEVGEDVQPHRDAAYTISYQFDDFMFNLVSYFDYVGNYIGVLLVGEKNHRLKWKGAINHVNNDKFEQKELCSLLKEIDKHWVIKLAKYRGDLIHQCPTVGEMKKSWSYSHESGLKTSLDFYIPKKLKKDFHIFRGDENIDILSAAERMLKESLVYATAIFSSLKELEFEYT